MTSNVMYARQHGNWQFSLKSLMFVTVVVAVCAALVNISIVLAVLLIPLFAAGLVATIRVVNCAEIDSDHAKAPGLFVTFCRTIALILAIVGVGLLAISFAGMAAVLIAVMVVIHVVRATGVHCHPLVNRARRILFWMANLCGATLTRIRPVAIVRWFQAQAVAGTISLFAACRRLLRQWWSTDSQLK